MRILLLSMLFICENAISELSGQSIYEQCWYSDSTGLRLKAHKKGYSFIAIDSLDSLDHSKLKVKKGQLIFIEKYWNDFFYGSIKQYFKIEKLTNDTLILFTKDSAHRILYAIFGLEHQDRIIFRKSEDMCVLKKSDFLKP